LRAFAAEAGIADRAHILGHRGDIPDLLAAADVYAMPSLWEGLPMALLEAMFAGKAIVASRASGIPEAIDEGKDGLLADPGDEVQLATALGRLITDANLRNRLGTAARARAEKEFSAAVMTEAYERAYGIRT
jgi:glycosyltransferase involved in cell wall biosynthesis